MIECFIDKMLNAPLILTEWQDQLWNMLWYRKRLFPLVVRIVHIQGGNDDHGQDGISILAVFFGAGPSRLFLLAYGKAL